METEKPKFLRYKRSHFATQLPVDFLYSPSHFWIGQQEDGLWRVGLTRFASRMLGEMVDHGFELEPGSAVHPGDVIGWIEGFKAISDLFCIAEGTFEGGNPLLREKISLVNKDCYNQGWIYQIRGRPDARCVDVQAYWQILDKTIDKILEQQKSDD